MTVDGSRALIAFVRGVNWRDLRELGLRIQPGTEIVVTVPADFPVVRPSLIDVATGLIYQGDDAARQRWAVVLLGVDNIDLTSLEREKNWPALLEALWDASRGRVSEESLALARSLVGAQVKH